MNQVRAYAGRAILGASSLVLVDKAQNCKSLPSLSRSVGTDPSQNSFQWSLFGNFLSRSLSILSSEPSWHRVQMESLHDDDGNESPSVDDDSAAPLYDFIVVGNGTCGQSAVQTLQSKCDGCRIAVVDPLRPLRSPEKTDRAIATDHYSTYVTQLDPVNRSISTNENGSKLRYRYGILLATGCHGAPVPHYIIDESVRDRVLELRSSVVADSEQRPVLSPESVYSRMIEHSKRKHSIMVLGSGWDAVNLAVSSKSLSNPHVSLMFGTHGPASHILPAYLSSAVSKRLKKYGIEVHGRSLVRYVAADPTKKHAQLYSAKSYDFLDTQLTSSNLIIVAPDVMGTRGNASLATNYVPDHLNESKSRKNRSWYRTWLDHSMNSVGDPSVVSCYKDDGRIAVNSEFYVGNDIFAAGSVAKYANAFTGHATVAGSAPHDAVVAGRCAALAMAKQYIRNNRSFMLGRRRMTSILAKSAAAPTTTNAIPVWRSDLLSYSGDQTSSLSKVGVYALCVGICDSELYATHGIWWTNQAAQRRFLRLLDAESNNDRRKAAKEIAKPVYGMGIVFYTDRLGRIQGIMTWGFPFTDKAGNLNSALVTHSKNILRTNGGFAALETEADLTRRNTYLEDEARTLVAISFGDGRPDRLEGDLHSFPRPLHRSTELRPPSMRSHGSLKLKQEGHAQGILGEDLFARYQTCPQDTPPPKPIIGVGSASAEGGSKAMTEAQNLYQWALWEQKERRFDENEDLARPPKEDPLWIRKGDERKNVAFKDTINAAYRRIIFGG